MCKGTMAYLVKYLAYLGYCNIYAKIYVSIYDLFSGKTGLGWVYWAMIGRL